MKDNVVELQTNLQSKIPFIIEAFVKFYGEEERERITQKLTDVLYVDYIGYESYSLILSQIKEQSSIIVAGKFLSDIGIEWKEEKYEKYFRFGFDSVSNNFYNFFNNYTKDSDYAKNNVLDSLKDIFERDDLTFDSIDFQKLYDQMLSYKDNYDNALMQYNEELKKYSYFFEQKDKLDKFTREKKNEYYTKMLERLKPYLSIHDQELIGDVNGYYKLECKNILIGYSFSSPALIDAFTTDSCEQLSSSEVSQYKKNNILQDRISYFKKMGYDLGDEYENYISNEEIQKIIPSKEFSDKIVEIRNELVTEYQKDCYFNRPDILDIRGKINQIGFVDQTSVPYLLLNSRITCVCPNYIQDGDGFRPYSQLFIDSTTSSNRYDCSLIHECNHLLELVYYGFDGKNIKAVCGWDINDGEVYLTEDEMIQKVDEESSQHRKYELFNEVINELIAQDITRGMHEDGIYLCSNPEKDCGTSRSSYQYAARLVYPFYEEYKQDIIASRKGNMQPLLDKIGEENFNRLNNLVKDYLEYFSGFKIYGTLDDIKNGKTSKDTEFYYNCINESKKINEDIQNYVANKESSL